MSVDECRRASFHATASRNTCYKLTGCSASALQTRPNASPLKATFARSILKCIASLHSGYLTCRLAVFPSPPTERPRRVRYHSEERGMKVPVGPNGNARVLQWKLNDVGKRAAHCLQQRSTTSRIYCGGSHLAPTYPLDMDPVSSRSCAGVGGGEHICRTRRKRRENKNGNKSRSTVSSDSAAWGMITYGVYPGYLHKPAPSKIPYCITTWHVITVASGVSSIIQQYINELAATLVRLHVAW